MTDLETLQGDTSGAESIAARDQALHKLLASGELVWIVAQHYDPVELLWDVDLIRSGAQARWLLQRYSYDASSGILHFRGERPLSDEEFASLRRQGKRF